MLEVQKYLRENSLEQLTAELGIKVKKYEQDGIVLLDYDQIDSPKTHPVVRECRSLILSLADYSVVSRKFNRFFNHGEALDLYKEFSFEGAIAFEKADGSLIGVYYNPFTNTWEISTRGMAKAEGQHAMGETFRGMVLCAFNFEDEQHFQDFSSTYLDKNLTYIFEYTSPLNRVVTPYKQDKMILLSVVENTEEVKEQLDHPLDMFLKNGLNVRRAEQHNISSFAGAKSLVDSLTDLKEGFVIYCTKTKMRMKMKSVNYLVAHKLKGNDPVPSRKNLLKATLGGDIDEFVSYFPEYEQYATPIKDEVTTFIAKMTSVWKSVSAVQDQKEFAMLVKEYPFSGVLFQAKKMCVSAKDVWDSLDVDRKLKMFA